ncbi:MAG: trimethylamine methyltransferase [Lachnospiraceae bacterium]|nr:trimethylamine methyltransferase [Lachnospiraceae bacterium]
MDNISYYASRKQLGIDVFSADQCAIIHQGVLEVLKEVGVDVHNEKALEILKKGGAFVDGCRVRFPAAMVEKALKSAPSQVTIYGRDMESKMVLGGKRFYYGAGPTVINTLDPYTKERKIPSLDDTCRAVKVMDALPNIDYLMDFGTISGVETPILDIYCFKAMFENSPKPILHWAYNRENTLAMIEMGAKVRGSLEELEKYPFFALYSEPITPLVHENEGLDVMMTMAEHGLPAVYTSAAQAGMTAPVTLAGTMVIEVAESLSGLVVNQLIKEGAPYVMGGVCTCVDMASMQITYGSPEFNLLQGGLSSMSQYYNLPVFTTAGCSDSKCLDQQSGIDIATSVLMSALYGGNLIHDVGYMESGLLTSLEALVIADEVIGQTKRIIKGIDVSEESLSLDTIKKVGPGGNFLAERETFNKFKTEWWLPKLFNRKVYAKWDADGKPELRDLANARVKKILETHQPKMLADDVVKACDDILSKMAAKCK